MSLCHQQCVRMYVRGFLERHFSAGSLQSSKGSLIEDAFTFFRAQWGQCSRAVGPGQAMGTGREQPPPSSLSALHNGAKSMILRYVFWNFIVTEPNNQFRTYLNKIVSNS